MRSHGCPYYSRGVLLTVPTRLLLPYNLPSSKYPPNPPSRTLFFSVSHVLALEQLLLAHPAGREELGQLPLVWRGNWRLFANT